MFRLTMTIFNDPSRVNLFALLCVVLPILLLSAHTRAASVCVSTAGQLNAAINAAETNNQSDDIRIRPGTYVAPIPNGFDYYPPSDDADVYNVTVSGGWNAGCSLMTSDATLTVLSGNLQSSVLRFRSAEGKMTVRNLTITAAYAASGVRGALQFDHVSGIGLAVMVDRVILHHNEIYAALYVKTQGTISVAGSLFHSNLTPSSGAGGARIINENGFNETYILNNTFAQNRATAGGTVGGLVVENADDALTFINNNIFWGNDNYDFSVIGSNASRNDCGYNDVGVFANVVVCNGSGVVDVDPLFSNPAAEDFRLAINSPLIDIGCNTVPCDRLPNIDLLGIPRPLGGGYDMGAYEGGYGYSDLMFTDGFD